MQNIKLNSDYKTKITQIKKHLTELSKLPTFLHDLGCVIYALSRQKAGFLQPQTETLFDGFAY